MKAYLDLLQHVLDHGTWEPTRAVLRSTGEHVRALSVFGTQTRYDLTEGFPAVTTKRLALKAMTAELLWFLKGETNVRSLQAQGVRIWDEWADSEGELGPIYGHQWRRWGERHGRGWKAHLGRAWDACSGRTPVDQIKALVEGIEEVRRDPTASVGRRLILSAWNVADVPRMALPPCHCLFQVKVTPDGRLHGQLYQRSADLFLGVPFNIASYALLLAILARATRTRAATFVHTIGDAHIYENHLAVVREQLTRKPLPLPRLDLERLSAAPWYFGSVDDVIFHNYESHPPLRGEVAV